MTNKAPNGFVKITNSKTNQESYVLPESVPVWEKNGWKAVAPPKDGEKNDTKTVPTLGGDKVDVVTS